MFINTTAVGMVDPMFKPGPDRARAGDAVIVTGNIGVHGITIMAAREGLAFDADLKSDTAALTPLVDALAVERRRRGPRIAGSDARRRGEHAERDRAGVEGGGRAGGADAARCRARSSAACEMLGLDPLYVANEGIFVAIVPEGLAEAAVVSLRAHPLGRNARKIGRVVAEHPGMVVMRTAIGGTRVVDMLPGDQLPRIC